MGSSGSKNKTHPLHQQEMRGLSEDMDYGYPHQLDQRYDYDSGVSEDYIHHSGLQQISFSGMRVNSMASLTMGILTVLLPKDRAQMFSASFFSLYFSEVKVL